MKKLFLLALLFNTLNGLAVCVKFNVKDQSKKIMSAKKYTLPKLPYAYNALEPYIDAETMKVHHDKHHQAYVDNLNKVLEKYPAILGTPLEELLSNVKSIPEDIREEVINQAGGHLNHSLFWLMMGPKSKRTPSGELGKAIVRDFGSFAKFKQEFETLAKKLFGSGWTWLCVGPDKKLLLVSTKDQDNPLSIGLKPLLALDEWEHAYYLKYQNRRTEYISKWWNVVNWDQIEKNYANALALGK